MSMYETREVATFGALADGLLELDGGQLWSFRGQRKDIWPLGVHDLPASDRVLQTRMKIFKRRCMEFSKPDYISEEDHWRWHFYAQHHRLKTRLLDWTTNPLVAIYFAVENVLSRGDDENDFGTVWAIHVNAEHFLTPDEVGGAPETVREWIMINPPPVTDRLVRQSGKFSYHPPSHKQPISEQLRPGEQLVKFVLRRSDRSNPASEIRDHLCTMNIHHAFMFPGPDGVAAFVNHEWPYRKLMRSIECT
ncbi:MAG: FRG domain-containing protein [bacterium]|nr:MAG: FRG domain-containing protein [bacterium]